MRDHYSVQALYNLLFWPVVPPRSAGHIPVMIGNPASPFDDSHRHSDSPIRHNTGYKVARSYPWLTVETTSTPPYSCANSRSRGTGIQSTRPPHRGG